MRHLRLISIAAAAAAASPQVIAHGGHAAAESAAHHDQLHLLMQVAASNAWLLAALAGAGVLTLAWTLGRRGKVRNPR